MIPFPDKKYQIIYADPPWSYNDKRDNGEYAGIKYRTMMPKEIADLSVKNISAKNCILFLWVTMPMLDICFEVINSWGFKYKTVGFAWVKIKDNIDLNEQFHVEVSSRGLGHYTKSNIELCLIATKGRLNRIEKNIEQILFAPRRQHSQKPEEAKKRIIDLYGDVPRIELFARIQYPGWDAWGNEVITLAEYNKQQKENEDKEILDNIEKAEKLNSSDFKDLLV